MDNTAAIYNIKKSGAKNLYHTARKIWKLSEKNFLILKAVHTSGRINVTTNKLSRLEMSRDYHLNEKVFQRIQQMRRCYPRVDLFASKKNRLIRTYALVIPRNDPDNIGNTLRLNWSNIKGPVFLHPPIPLLLKVLRKFQEEGKIAILIAPSWKGQVWTDLIKKLTISTIPLGKSKNVLSKGRTMIKRELQLLPGNINAYLLRNLSYTMKTKESLTPQQKERRNTVDHVNYRE
jgi:hypothetical protein